MFVARCVRPRALLGGLGAAARRLSGGRGLFGYDGLHAPSDFLRLSRSAVERAEGLRAEACSGRLRGLEVLAALDDMSNAVCEIIDAAELCRSAHAAPEWRGAAQGAFEALSGYINALNADRGLYDAVRGVTEAGDFSSLSEESQRMATLMMQELERGGIHLDEGPRNDLLEMSGEITQLETLFSANLTEESPAQVAIRDGKRRLAPYLSASSLDALSAAPAPETSFEFSAGSDLCLPVQPALFNGLLRAVSDVELRRTLYTSLNSPAHPNVAVLDALVAKRHEAAAHLGFASHAHRVAVESMAKTPEGVEAFLLGIAERLGPRCEAELRTLSALNGGEKVMPWDVPFLTSAARAAGAEPKVVLGLESVIEVLGELCARLFGISMVEGEASAAELWAPEVRKFEFREGGRLLGTAYLDLFAREGKYPHAAHFTVRCGRKRDILDAQSDAYQTPIVALVFNFARPSGAAALFGRSDAALHHSEVETLFHEFGHMMHSLLSETQFQHLSGTRVPVDFVETPSHLFEYFAWDHRVLQNTAKTPSGASVAADELEALRRARRAFSALDTQRQVLYGLLDQRVFGAKAGESAASGRGLDAAGLAMEIQRDLGLPAVPRDAWFARFGHFVGYGAGYYGYLFTKLFAANIWADLFEEDPLSARAGRTVWKKMLAPGGAKDPNDILRDVLGREPTADAFLGEVLGDGPPS